MQPKKTTNYQCHYPRIKEDSAYHYENCNLEYSDSVKSYYKEFHIDYMASGDFQQDENGNYYEVYIPRVGKLVEENLSYIGLQNYIVPTFFAIILTMLIFGLIVIRDSKKGEKEKVKESILNFMSEEDS